MFNQGIFPYILSKITVLGTFAAIQSLLFVLIIYTNFKGSSPKWNDPALSFVWMLVISIAASFMGLLLSAVVSTTEKVMTLVPIALIPQIMLAGIVAKINNVFVEFLSYLTLARWGTEGFSIIQKDVAVPNLILDKENSKFDDRGQLIEPVFKEDGTKMANAKEELVKQFYESYDNTFGSWHATMKLDLLVVGIISLIFFISIYIALKSKDSMKIK